MTRFSAFAALTLAILARLRHAFCSSLDRRSQPSGLGTSSKRFSALSLLVSARFSRRIPSPTAVSEIRASRSGESKLTELAMPPTWPTPSKMESVTERAVSAHSIARVHREAQAALPGAAPKV
jgi:hypothetical protein